MRVKNRKCIRRLSFKSLWASRKRNIIAICAIALTTLMFTSLFTIMLSVNSSYETYNFRQAGGYSDGSFKDLSREQADKIAAHKGIKASGERIVCGFSSSDVFGKVAAEVSYMDKNCTKWSYATPTTGKEPQKENEIAMDTTALRLLGVEPKLGTNVTITYQAGNGTDTGIPQTDSFILVGYWEYDDLMPVHYINVSKAYVDKINEKCIAAGDEALDIDLNVMLPSKLNIREQMEKIDTDLGYDWNTRDQENSARIGVNWGLTASSVSSDIDFSLVAAILAFSLLIIFTGYLIIYNIFQISVTGDIRFYGLLKTIGTTPRQLRHIITQEALFLCIIGIPVGLLLGYGIGAVLTPIALETTSIIGTKAAISSSPLIFIGSAVFAIITVFLSCRKPGKMAAKVSPVEAAKYTEGITGKKKKRHSRGAKVYQMAFANLGRNKKKTILVVVSLTLSVTLLNVLFSLVNGFDMDKYVDRSTCADFIVSSTDYFRYNTADEYIGADTIDEIKENTDETVSGSGYDLADISPMMWMETDQYSKLAENYLSGKELQEEISHYEQKGDSILVDVSIEGFDDGLFDKLTVVKGSLEPLSDPDSHAIAVAVSTDDYGNIVNLDNYPELGDTYTVNYQIGYDIDSRTGERADQQTTPEEYLEYHEEEAKEVEYSVCALVTVPDSISFRYTSLGYSMVLPVEKLKEDSGIVSCEKFRKAQITDKQINEIEDVGFFMQLIDPKKHSAFILIPSKNFFTPFCRKLGIGKVNYGINPFRDIYLASRLKDANPFVIVYRTNDPATYGKAFTCFSEKTVKIEQSCIFDYKDALTKIEPNIIRSWQYTHTRTDIDFSYPARSINLKQKCKITLGTRLSFSDIGECAFRLQNCIFTNGGTILLPQEASRKKSNKLSPEGIVKDYNSQCYMKFDKIMEQLKSYETIPVTDMQQSVWNILEKLKFSSAFGFSNTRDLQKKYLSTFEKEGDALDVVIKILKIPGVLQRNYPGTTHDRVNECIGKIFNLKMEKLIV